MLPLNGADMYTVYFFLSGKATTTNMTPSSFSFSVSICIVFHSKVKNKQTNKSTKHNETSGELRYRGTRDRTTISTTAVT